MFILLCELYFKCIIQSGHEVTKEYFFWYISYLLCMVTIDEGCMVRLNQWHGWGHGVWDPLSRTVVLQLLHSIWNILIQKCQYCEAPMVLVCRWNKIMEWWLAQCFLVYTVAEDIGVKESKFAFDGFKLVDPSHWHTSFDVACATCACVSSKVKIFCSMSVNLEVHMFDHEIK